MFERCSTPYGILDGFTGGRKQDCRHCKVLNALRHIRWIHEYGVCNDYRIRHVLNALRHIRWIHISFPSFTVKAFLGAQRLTAY